jgi:hypothetical protein
MPAVQVIIPTDERPSTASVQNSPQTGVASGDLDEGESVRLVVSSSTQCSLPTLQPNAKPSVWMLCAGGFALGIVQGLEMVFLPVGLVMPIAWGSLPFDIAFYIAGLTGELGSCSIFNECYFFI